MSRDDVDAWGARSLDRGVRRETVLAGLSPAKRRVLEAVHDHPGAVVSDLAQAMGCSYANIDRHLAVLRRQGLVVREKLGRGVRHYSVLEDTLRSRLLGHWANEKRQEVLRLLANHPDRQWVPNEIALELGLQHAFVQRFLKRLRAQGLIHINKLNARYYVRSTADLVAGVQKIAGDGMLAATQAVRSQ